MVKKWMKKATENAHGQFKAKAEAAGESTLEFAHGHDKGSSTTAKHARLAEVLIGSHKKHKSSGHMIKSMYGNKKG